MLRKHLRRITEDRSAILYLSVLLGVVLPAGAAWVILVRPTRPPIWVHIVLAFGVGTAMALLAHVADWFVDRRSEQKTAARAKAMS